jgi:arabinofuranosyltransferase
VRAVSRRDNAIIPLSMPGLPEGQVPSATEGVSSGELTQAPPFRPDRRLVFLILAVFLLLIVRTAWVADDAYISFRTIDNFVNGYGLRWNIDERVQSYTHPLWVLLLIPLYWISREPYWTSLAANTALAAMAVWIVVGRLARTTAQAVAVGALLISSKAFLEYSTAGMENALLYLLLAIFVLMLTGDCATPRTLRRLSALVAAIMLTRMDAALLVLPACAVAVGRNLFSRRAAAALLTGLLPFLVWEAFSLFYYGVPLPNTAYAKLQTGVPIDEALEQGFLYLADWINLDPVGVIVLSCGLLAPVGQFSRRAHAIKLGLVLWCAYVVWIGGDFMVGRLFSIAVLMGACLIAQAEWRAPEAVWWGVAAASPLMALMSAAPAITTGGSLGLDIAPWQRISPAGITDERPFYYQTTGLLAKVHGREVCRHPWALEAIRERDAGKKVIPGLSIGFAGFCVGPSVHVLDIHALSDPLLARLPGDPRWRPGHLPRQVPDGYIETLETGVNHLRNRTLARYYDTLAEVTRGPLWSWTRVGAIARLNATRVDLVSAVRPTVDARTLPRLYPGPVPWDSPEAQVMGAAGLEIRFDRATAGRQLYVSVSGNDRYRLELYDGDRRIETLTIRPNPIDPPDLTIRRLTLPRKQFDRILVRGRRGDFRYSLGHLAVVS